MLKNQNDNEKENTNTELTEEQLIKNKAKLEEYEKILKITVIAVALMFAIIACIVFGLIINNN